MGKDFFGNERFHCTHPGCMCGDYWSRAQQDMLEAEELAQGDEDNAVEVLESKYNRMTCQAKSEYQLTCFHCGHNVSAHATKKRDVSIEQGHPAVLYVLQGVCFRKSGSEPDKAGVVKLKRATGTPFQTTGRSWTGPSGGVWAELMDEQKPGWVLVEGPGFGVDGPILGKELPVENGHPEVPVAVLPPPAPAPVPALAPAPVVPPAPRPHPAAAAALAATTAAKAASAKREGLSVVEVKAALKRISEACRSPEFAKRAEDPLQVGELFIEACARPAADFGFGSGEDGVRRLFAAIRPHSEDASASAELADIESALQLGQGSVMALVESM